MILTMHESNPVSYRMREHIHIELYNTTKDVSYW